MGLDVNVNIYISNLLSATYNYRNSIDKQYINFYLVTHKSWISVILLKLLVNLDNFRQRRVGFPRFADIQFCRRQKRNEEEYYVIDEIPISFHLSLRTSFIPGAVRCYICLPLFVRFVRIERDDHDGSAQQRIHR